MNIYSIAAFTVFLILAYLIYQWKIEEDIKNKRLRKVINSLSVVVIIPVFITLAFQIEQTKREQEQRKRDEILTKEIKSTLNVLLQKEVDIKDVEELIKLKYKEVFESSEIEAQKWTDGLMKSLAQKQEELKSLSAQGEKLANTLRLKWKPFYDFTLKVFDDRIHLLEKNNMIKSFKKWDNPDIVIVDTPSQKFYDYGREVVFKNGNIIRVQTWVAQIKRGQLIKHPRIIFQDNLHSTYGRIFIRFDKEKFWFTDIMDGRIYKTTDDPLLDEKFRNKLTEVINKSISIVTVEDTFKTESQR